MPIFPDLTEREREVLALIAHGLTNNGIAEQLVLSPKTVHNSITEIFSKSQVADRAQAIIRARNAGLAQATFLRIRSMASSRPQNDAAW